jgi:hypothetical protein
MQYNNPTYYEIRGGDGEVELYLKTLCEDSRKEKGIKKD